MLPLLALRCTPAASKDAPSIRSRARSAGSPFSYDPASVADSILSIESPGAVYESGVTGFPFCREPRCLGVDCVIGAVSKMQRPAADKRRLSKYLPRNGQCHPGGDDQRRRLGTWTRAHWAWIEAAEMADPTAQQTLDCYKERVKRAVDEKKDLESKVESQSEQPRWKPTMDVLSCMKGIDVVISAVSVSVFFTVQFNATTDS